MARNSCSPVTVLPSLQLFLSWMTGQLCGHLSDSCVFITINDHPVMQLHFEINLVRHIFLITALKKFPCMFFLQSDVIHQSVYELIHTEDRPEFQRQLHWTLNPTQCADSGQRIDGKNVYRKIVLGSFQCKSVKGGREPLEAYNSLVKVGKKWKDRSLQLDVTAKSQTEDLRNILTKDHH